MRMAEVLSALTMERMLVAWIPMEAAGDMMCTMHLSSPLAASEANQTEPNILQRDDDGRKAPPD